MKRGSAGVRPIAGLGLWPAAAMSGVARFTVSSKRRRTNWQRAFRQYEPAWSTRVWGMPHSHIVRQSHGSLDKISRSNQGSSWRSTDFAQDDAVRE